jgi:hypothetical protein
MTRGRSRYTRNINSIKDSVTLGGFLERIQENKFRLSLVSCDLAGRQEELEVKKETRKGQYFCKGTHGLGKYV